MYLRGTDWPRGLDSGAWHSAGSLGEERPRLRLLLQGQLPP